MGCPNVATVLFRNVLLCSPPPSCRVVGTFARDLSHRVPGRLPDGLVLGGREYRVNRGCGGIQSEGDVCLSRPGGVIMRMAPVLSRPIVPPLFAYEKLALHFKPFQVQDETQVGKHPERLTDAAGQTGCFIAFPPTQPNPTPSQVRHGL